MGRIKELQKSNGLAGWNIDSIAKELTNVDKTIIKIAKSVQEGTATIEDLDNALASCSVQTSSFVPTLKNVAANMGIMLAASLAIKGIAYLWDKANVTLEEQQKIVDNLKSEITTLREEEQKLLGLRDEGSTFIYNKAPI